MIFLCSLHQMDHWCGSQATSVLGTRSFFPRAAGCFGVGCSISRAGYCSLFFWPKPETAHEKSLARGKPLLFRIAKHKSYKVVSANILRKVSLSTMSLFFGGYQFKNSSKNIIWKQELLHSISVTLLILLLPAASLAAGFPCTCVSIFWLLHQKPQSPLITPQGTFCL